MFVLVNVLEGDLDSEEVPVGVGVYETVEVSVGDCVRLGVFVGVEVLVELANL